MSLPHILIGLGGQKQLLMGAPGRDVSILQHQDLIGVHDGGKPVGYHDQRFFFCQPADGLLQLILVFRVNEGRGLVQNDDGRVLEDGPGDGKALPLPAGQPRAGISGVVASPKEAARLREILGPDAYIVTPGVRPAGSDRGDQSRGATPAQAFANGASHIVIGRPITQAADPAAAFESIAAEL